MVSFIFPLVASYPAEKYLAPMSLRLQDVAGKSLPATHWPFHFGGTGPRSPSLKLCLSGQIPVSMTPMTRSDPESVSWSNPALSAVLRPKNSGERVVWSRRTCSGMRVMTWESVCSFCASKGESFAEKPWNTVSYV